MWCRKICAGMVFVSLLLFSGVFPPSSDGSEPSSCFLSIMVVSEQGQIPLSGAQVTVKSFWTRASDAAYYWIPCESVIVRTDRQGWAVASTPGSTASTCNVRAAGGAGNIYKCDVSVNSAGFRGERQIAFFDCKNPAPLVQFHLAAD